MAKAAAAETIRVGEHDVRISNPSKVVFAEAGLTKRDIVDYYLAVAEGAVRGVHNRPMQLERYVRGASAPPFYQKRAPPKMPEWMQTVRLRFPSMRTADEIVVTEAAQLCYIVNLGCLALHPHPVRADDLDHPDELRIDLDPIPGVEWPQVRDVALMTRTVLNEHGLVAWPKTSGSRGMHLLVRIAPKWGFQQVRKAALAVAREVAGRMPGVATAKWWKEERKGVFLDYNQNAKDRTVAAAYSVRAKPDARVSAPLTWDEVPDCDAGDFTVNTMPQRFRTLGDPHAGIDQAVGDLESLLALGEAQEQAQGDAPWPPHYAKGDKEPPRVQPSRKKKVTNGTGRRTPTKPMVIVAESEDEAAALAGLERWKAVHPGVVPLLEPHHVLVDKMRGRFQTWTRVRVNLENVPVDTRPEQGTPDPDGAPRWDGGPPEAL